MQNPNPYLPTSRLYFVFDAIASMPCDPLKSMLLDRKNPWTGENEKIATLRAAISRVSKENQFSVKTEVKNGLLFVRRMK